MHAVQDGVIDRNPIRDIEKISKTGVPIVLEMNEELRDLIEWFRNWKRDQEIISPYLMVYPRYFGMRSRTKPNQCVTNLCRSAGQRPVRQPDLRAGISYGISGKRVLPTSSYPKVKTIKAGTNRRK